MRLLVSIAAALLLSAVAVQPSAARDRATAQWPIPAHGVIGVEDAQLDPAFWVARLADADRVVLDRDAIAAQNARLQRLDRSIHDLEALPATLPREQVAGWVGGLSRRPTKPLFDERGQPVPVATIDDTVANANLDAIAAQQPTRYGLVVHRADLRAFPTRLRVFTSSNDHDIDRFQESALFPGDPVAIVHESRDGQWWFVVSPRYAAWIEKRHVAQGKSADVLGYTRKAPYRIVTGATARTLFTPEEP